MKIRTRSLVIGSIVAVGIVAIVSRAAYLQFGSRYTSPPSNVGTTIAGKHITIEYYAPSMHGRKIMGGLVPFAALSFVGFAASSGRLLTRSADSGVESGSLVTL